MELKQKVIRVLVIIICIIVLAAGGYLGYFIVSDTLKPPPSAVTFGNLFVAKQQKDIESLKKTTNINECKIWYDSILLSLKEDKINSFIDNEQSKSLDKQLNFSFTERFIVLANKYFAQPEWQNNHFVSEIIAEIKNNGFVESNSRIWNILQGFEKNITCYNDMQRCISRINAITNNLKNYIPVNEISDLKTQKQNLVTRNCVKNKGVESELINGYKNLEEQAKANARLTVTPTTLEFDASESSKTIKVNTNVSSWSRTGAHTWQKIKESDSSLTITCEANPNTTERTGNINIKISFDKFETPWERIFAPITVKQEGKVSQNNRKN